MVQDIIVGNEKISGRQRHLLNQHRTDRGYRGLLMSLHEVVADEEIQRGIENLHPGWIDLFSRNRNNLVESGGRHLPQEFVSQILEFFDPLVMMNGLLAEVDPRNEEITFLLGAGASKPQPSGIPTVAELLDQLLDRARRLDREEMTNLADFCSENDIRNIEDLLTAVQISAFCSRNPSILSLVELQLFDRQQLHRGMPGPGAPRFRQQTRMRADAVSTAYLHDTFQLLFGLLSNLMLPSNPNNCHQAIVDYIRSKPGTSIVTTNYDCCMDRSLIKNKMPFSYTIEFANGEVLNSVQEEAVQLIKLHGSLNWFYCETCQVVRLLDIEQAVRNYENNLAEYPIISVCRECGGQSRGLLVPPHAMKFDVAPPLQPLIAYAAQAFTGKSLIVVVGFSFSDADLYISRMLIKAMQSSEETKLVIVDPAPDVISRIRRKFENQIPEFDGMSRILGLQGDCADTLPKFLRGELLKARQTESVPEAVAPQENPAAP